MLCGLVGSEPTVTASIALSAEITVGLKVTAMVHDVLPERFAPQEPPVIVKSAALVPLSALLIERLKGDLLVTVAFKGFDDVCETVPYESVAGVTVSGIVGPVLSATM